MKTSYDGRKLIEQFEGCRLEAYQDSVGVWTIGYGHTGTDVFEGKTITSDEADSLLAADLETAERCVNNCVAVEMTQGMFDALVSFVYNLGCGTLRNSTLLRKLNDGDDTGASDEFARFNKAGGKVLPGLVSRREAERESFLA